MTRIGTGPKTPPHGSRTLHITYAQYQATVWQLGTRLGTIWTTKPPWTQHPSSEWACSKDHAKTHFDQLQALNQLITYTP